MLQVMGYLVYIILFSILIFGIVICRKGLSIDHYFYSKIMWSLILMTVGAIYQLLIPAIVPKMLDRYITNGESIEPIVNYAYLLHIVDKLIFIIAIALLLISLRHKLSKHPVDHDEG